MRQFQNPSVSALQRALKVSHGEAAALVAQLQEEGVLLAPLPGRAPGLHPDYRRQRVRCVAGNERLCYSRQVAHAALLCFELAEEGGTAIPTCCDCMCCPASVGTCYASCF